jgi:ribosomal protein S18 acetylase RimI-like enzyme
MEGARAATVADLATVEVLAEAGRAEATGRRGGLLWARREGRRPPLRELLADPAHHVVVGTIDGTVVGYGILRIEELADPPPLARILECFVEPGARAVGVGEAIVTALVAEAQARGCGGVDALALPGDRAAKNFFETHRFTARLLVMHRPLR